MKRKLKLAGVIAMSLVSFWAIHRFWVSADRWAEQPIAQLKIGDLMLMVMIVCATIYTTFGGKKNAN